MNTDVEAALIAYKTDMGEDASLTAEVLIAAAAVGPNIRRIAAALGKPRKKVAPICRRARESGIFRGSRVDASDGWESGVSFILDCLVVDGYMEREEGPTE